MKTRLALLATLLALAGGLSAQTTADADLANRAAALHRRLFTIDTHLDTPTVQWLLPGWDFSQRHDWPTGFSQCDLPRMREGGLTAAFFAIYLEPGARTPAALLAGPNRRPQALPFTSRGRTTGSDCGC